MTETDLIPFDRPLDVAFKGDRDYLQSADLWNAVVSSLFGAGIPETDRKMTANFRQLLVCVPRLVSLPAASPVELGADIALTGASERQLFGLARTGVPVPDRKPDTEPAIIPHLRMQDGACFFQGPPVATPVELIVAATKFLHLRSVDATIKWLATRITLSPSFAISPSDILSIKIQRILENKASVSQIMLNGSTVGSISFNPRPPSA